MKRYNLFFLTIFTILTFSFTAAAQIHIGGGLAFGTSISKLGINARALVNINEKFVAQPGVSFFFKDKAINGVDVTYLSIDLDVHYKLITIGDNVNIFPLGGLNIFKIGVKGDNASGVNLSRGKGTKVGLDLGLGTQIETTSSLSYFGEYKITIAGIDQSTITVGVLYGF